MRHSIYETASKRQLHIWQEPDLVTLQLWTLSPRRSRMVKSPALAITPEQYREREADILHGTRLVKMVYNDAQNPVPEATIEVV